MWKLAVLCLVILSGCLGQNADEVLLSLDISLSHAHVGDEVVLYCTIYDAPHDTSIYWFKAVMTSGGEKMEAVAVSETALPPYDRFDRFTFDTVTSGTTQSYTMKILGVQVDDNGHWGCSYREEPDNVYESEMLEVYDDIDDISVYVNMTWMPQDGIMVLADEPIELEINVSRSNPRPVIQVYLGDTDITEDLAHTSYTHILCSIKDPNKNCSLSYSISSKAFGHFTFNGHQDTDIMTIVSHVPGSGFNSINKTYPLIIDHIPLFRFSEKRLARRGANFTITATVNARPAVDFVYWRMVKDDKETYAFPDIYLDEWNALASVERVDDRTCEVSLKLFLVTDFQYTDYELCAGNEQGNKSVVIELSEDFSPPVGPSSASFTTSNIIMLLLAILVFQWMRYD